MKLPIALIGAAFAAVLAMTLPAAAANAFTTTAVNMRIGAGANYPRITTIPAHAAVTVHGCVRNWTWCDTSWSRYRGWVSARYLRAMYQGVPRYLRDYGPRIGVPIISFHFGTYWDRYYRDRAWYRDQRWYRDPRWHRDPPRMERPPRIEQPPRIERPRMERPPRMEQPRIERPRMERPPRVEKRWDGPRSEAPRLERPRAEGSRPEWREPRSNERKLRKGEPPEEEEFRRRPRESGR